MARPLELPKRFNFNNSMIYNFENKGALNYRNIKTYFFALKYTEKCIKYQQRLLKINECFVLEDDKKQIGNNFP